jgi:hypothetical protein
MNDFAYQFTIAIAAVTASFFGYELDQPLPEPVPVIQAGSTKRTAVEVDFTRDEESPPIVDYPLVAVLPDGTESIQDSYSEEFGPWRCQHVDGRQMVFGGNKPQLTDEVTCWPESETLPSGVEQ